MPFLQAEGSSKCLGDRTGLAQHRILIDSQRKLKEGIEELKELEAIDRRVDSYKLAQSLGKVVGPRPNPRRRLKATPIKNEVIVSRFAESGALETHKVKIELSGCSVVSMDVHSLIKKVRPDLLKRSPLADSYRKKNGRGKKRRPRHSNFYENF